MSGFRGRYQDTAERQQHPVEDQYGQQLVARAGDVRYREARIHGDLRDVVVGNILDAQHLVDREPSERAFDLDQRARRIGIRAACSIARRRSSTRTIVSPTSAMP